MEIKKNKIAFIVKKSVEKAVNSISYDVKETDNTQGIKSIELNNEHRFELAPVPKNRKRKNHIICFR